MTRSSVIFPDGARFAFSIIDDTDCATLDYVRPIYELLAKLGFRTTKTVWPLAYDGPCDDQGSHSLQDAEYADFLQQLQAQGFEIGYHGARMVSSPRPDTSAAFEMFHDRLGRYPTVYAAHAENRENLYWSGHRFRSRVWRRLYQTLHHSAISGTEGHDSGSPYYWADIAHERLRYVRSFSYDELNLWNITPEIPYRTRNTYGVRAYFPSSFADNVEEFIELLSPKRLDALERERGLCIVGTHFGKGFLRDGRVHPGVADILTRLSARPGWYRPVSTILDHLVNTGAGGTLLEGLPLFLLEGKWFWHSVRRSRKSRSYEKTERPYLERSVNRSSQSPARLPGS
jgi:hypothetical protein